jgi:arsenate reductase-like glutaredoxin family protein
MQLRKVVSWLSMHNFPYGVVSFADGISTDPLRHKTEYLKGGWPSVINYSGSDLYSAVSVFGLLLIERIFLTFI